MMLGSILALLGLPYSPGLLTDEVLAQDHGLWLTMCLAGLATKILNKCRTAWVVVKIMVPFWVPQILGAVLY